MSPLGSPLFSAVEGWLAREHAVESAVLFGSRARDSENAGGADAWSDLDLHVIARSPARLEKIDWAREIGGEDFCMQVLRPATGGVKKASALFSIGQIDLVIVPRHLALLARLLMACRLHRRSRAAWIALNEWATCLHTGYRFLKGGEIWESFYERVARGMPGVRMDDFSLTNAANVFLADLLWVLQKVERGELVAAQHVLHRHLGETNLRFMREIRLRRQLPVPSFGLGRRAEMLSAPAELQRVKINAALVPIELRAAAWQAFAGMKEMMGDLAPSWNVPEAMALLLSRYAPTPAR
jgi:hypothetical protein